MPDSVATHFGFTGVADGWGWKGTLWFLPLAGLLVYAALTLLSRYPHRYNYPVAITEQNAERQYRNARSLVACVKAESIWVFAIINAYIIRVALHGGGLPTWLLPVIVVVVLGSIAWYLCRALRAA